MHATVHWMYVVNIIKMLIDATEVSSNSFSFIVLCINKTITVLYFLNTELEKLVAQWT